MGKNTRNTTEEYYVCDLCGQEVNPGAVRWWSLRSEPIHKFHYVISYGWHKCDDECKLDTQTDTELLAHDSCVAYVLNEFVLAQPHNKEKGQE